MFRGEESVGHNLQMQHHHVHGAQMSPFFEPEELAGCFDNEGSRAARGPQDKRSNLAFKQS